MCRPTLKHPSRTLPQQVDPDGDLEMLVERFACSDEHRLRRHTAWMRQQLVEPAPATHALWTQWKAGEIVYQTGELLKTLLASGLRIALRFKRYQIHKELPNSEKKTVFARPSIHLVCGSR